MTFGAGAYALGFFAGLLSILSPCVLPLLPLVLATSAGAHRRGPFALAAGLAFSFAIVGTTIAWAAGQLGFDTGALRVVGAVLLVALGLALLSSALQQRFASATSGVATRGTRGSRGSRRKDSPANGSSASCSASSGVPAWVRRSAAPSRSRARGGISDRSRC